MGKSKNENCLENVKRNQADEANALNCKKCKLQFLKLLFSIEKNKYSEGFKKIKKLKIRIFGIRFSFTFEKFDFEKAFNALINTNNRNHAENKKRTLCRAEHSKVFPKYKNIYDGKTISIIAPGPSLKHFKIMDNVIYIGVNKAFKFGDIKFDYLFAQDYESTKGYLSDFMESNCHKFLGASHIDNASIPEYFYKYPCTDKYYTIYPYRDIQVDISQCPLADYGSVTFAAMNFALYTHPQTIYLVGCDCSSNGYWDGSIQQANETILNKAVAYNKTGWSEVQKFIKVHYPDVEIISVNPVGLRGMFKDVYTKSFIEENPELQKDDLEII